MNYRHRWLTVSLFALAMAWVESAVVFYLRTMLDRIEPHQANPLPLLGDLERAEVIREFATIVMLGTLATLAGHNRRERFGWFLVAFGIWDLGYYGFLKVLTGWPHSLLDWDILFLIPLPWWGPVLAPALIALLMVALGTLMSRTTPAEAPRSSRSLTWWTAGAGALCALYAFMADALKVAGQGEAAIRELLPESFQWPVFLVGLGLMSIPVAGAACSRQRNIGVAGLNCSRWLRHFQRNRESRPEPDWSAPITLPREVIAPLVRSLEQFRLGDGGGPASLIARDAESFRGSSEDLRQVVDLWFAEEREHARLLDGAVRRFGGRPIDSHWSFTCFCACRRLLGVRFELQVLLLTEIVSTAYYRVMRRHGDDPPLRAMCSQILRDEAGHVAFHQDRLVAAGRPGEGLFRALWAAQFRGLGYAAATMLWINHAAGLTALGGRRSEYYREVRRELSRFLWRLARTTHPGRSVLRPAWSKALS